MSQRYNRYTKAEPNSFKALQSEAWLEHSARFRPKLVALQESMRKQLDKATAKKKSVSSNVLKKISLEITDYIVFSGSSFLEYLCKYEAAYLSDLLENRGVEVTDKAFKNYDDLLRTLVKSRTDKQKPKRKKKRKTKRKIKK